LQKPVGSLTDKPQKSEFGSSEGHWNNVTLAAQVKNGPQKDTMPAEVNKPVGTLKDRPHNPMIGSNEGPYNNIGVA
jgi:hypothetical protein